MHELIQKIKNLPKLDNIKEIEQENFLQLLDLLPSRTTAAFKRYLNKKLRSSPIEPFDPGIFELLKDKPKSSDGRGIETSEDPDLPDVSPSEKEEPLLIKVE